MSAAGGDGNVSIGVRPMRLAWHHWAQVGVHLASLAPLMLLLNDALRDDLTFNPIQAATQRTGRIALILLILSLACTPASRVLGLRVARRWRRPLGLYAFLYASVHVLIFALLDYGLDLGLIWADIFTKRYALVGLAAFLLLLPLALTSTRASIRRLGRNWQRLHRLAYLAAGLAVVHFTWAVKSDVRLPLSFGALLLLLLALRTPSLRMAGLNIRRRLVEATKGARVRSRGPRDQSA